MENNIFKPPESASNVIKPIELITNIPKPTELITIPKPTELLLSTGAKSEFKPPDKKVLILIPTNSAKSYCAGRFFKNLAKLDLSHSNILFSEDTVSLDVNLDPITQEVTRGRPDEYMHFIQSLGYEVIKCKETVAKSEQLRQQNPNLQLRIRDRLCLNRENLRREFLKRKEYTHACFIDSDVLVPKDAVERLLAHNKHITAAVYWQNAQRMGMDGKPFIGYDPVAYKYVDKETWQMHEKTKCSFDNFGAIIANEELMPSRLIPEDEDDIHITAIGFGCTMLSRELLEKPWNFRYTTDTPGTEDMWFSLDIKKYGYRIFLDTYIHCRHYPRAWIGPK